MDVDVLFGLISEAATTVREIGADYIGKPFSAAMVRDLSDKVERSLDGINSELSDLGIEVYADVVPMVCDLSDKVERSLDGINSELRNDLGIEVYADVVPMVYEYRVKGHLRLRKAGDHGKL